MHINTASSSDFFGCERKCNLMFFFTPNASSSLASSNKFTYLMSKSICTFYTCATHSLCIKDGSAARSAVLFLCCSRLQNYLRTDLRGFKRQYRARYHALHQPRGVAIAVLISTPISPSQTMVTPRGCCNV